jgi:hypothetical protein
MTERDLTQDELVRAARFLFGAAETAARQGQSTVVVPVRTATALGRAILGALNAE